MNYLSLITKYESIKLCAKCVKDTIIQLPVKAYKAPQTTLTQIDEITSCQCLTYRMCIKANTIDTTPIANGTFMNFEILPCIATLNNNSSVEHKTK